jgi:hypothetical protein
MACERILHYTCERLINRPCRSRALAFFCPGVCIVASGYICILVRIPCFTLCLSAAVYKLDYDGCMVCQLTV